MDTTLTQNGQTTPPVIAEAYRYADGWTRLAAFLEDHPEIAERVEIGPTSRAAMCYLSHRVENPARFMADAAKACVDAGGRVEQDVDDGRFAGVKLIFGPIHIAVFTEAARVCATRVTGMVEQVEYTLTFDLPEQAAEGSEATR